MACSTARASAAAIGRAAAPKRARLPYTRRRVPTTLAGRPSRAAGAQAEINAQTRINWILGALFIGFGIILAGSIVDNRAEIREVFAIIERFFNGEL